MDPGEIKQAVKEEAPSSDQPAPDSAKRRSKSKEADRPKESRRKSRSRSRSHRKRRHRRSSRSSSSSRSRSRSRDRRRDKDKRRRSRSRSRSRSKDRRRRSKEKDDRSKRDDKDRKDDKSKSNGDKPEKKRSRSRTRSRSRSPEEKKKTFKPPAWLKKTKPTNLTQPGEVEDMRDAANKKNFQDTNVPASSPAASPHIKQPVLKTVKSSTPAPVSDQTHNKNRTEMIEVVLNDRLGKKVRVKVNQNDTVGDLKKLAAAQLGTRPDKIRIQKWYLIYKDNIPLEDYEIHDGMGLELYYM